MKLWILYSPLNMGGDRLALQIKLAFEKIEEISQVELIPDTALHARFETSGLPDSLLVLNALESYMGWRFSIPGRPWVCVASFCYADLYTLYRGSVRLDETGINMVLTNCSYYVERASVAVPAKLCYSPVYPFRLLQDSDNKSIGTVLPNVVDRDFSLVSWVYEKVKQRGMEDRFVIFQEYNGDSSRLPGDLHKVTKVNNYPDIYVPAPRITDYRSGVLPFELIQAWYTGCRTLVAFHPILEPLNLKMYGSLAEIEQELDKFEAGEDLEPIGEPDKLFCPSVEDFVEEVMQARERWERDRITA